MPEVKAVRWFRVADTRGVKCCGFCCGAAAKLLRIQVIALPDGKESRSSAYYCESCGRNEGWTDEQ